MKNKTISLLFLLLPIYILSGQEYYFKHYKVENGLSHNTVKVILQDKTGFLWFGTKDGLNKFDGYNFKIFQNDPDNVKSLGSNSIEYLHEYNDDLWVGTDAGLYLYDDREESFELLEASLNILILDIEHDDDGNLWYIGGTTLFKYNISTKKNTTFDTENYFHNGDLTRTPNGTIWTSKDNFLNRYDKNTNTFKRIEIDIATENAIKISKIFALDDNTLLVGTENYGVVVFDIQKEIFTRILPGIGDHLYVRNFLKKDSNELWIATESGIFIYNLINQTYKNLKKSYNNPYALSDNAIYSLAQDKEGGVWIGTYFGGINYYPKQYTTFNKYFPKTGENSISGNAVREIKGDEDGNIWIGTEDAGLNKFDPKTGLFTNYKPSEDSRTLSHYNIHGLLPKGDSIWIGTFQHGLDIMDKNTGNIIKTYKTNDNTGLSSNFTYTFYEGEANQLFIISSSGIQKYNAETDTFLTMNAFPEGILFTSFLEDDKGILWGGSIWDGLFYYNPTTKEKGIYQQGSNPNSISSNAINGIFKDSKHNLWVTTENGLNLYRSNTNDFKTYSTKDGFPSNVFYAVIEDDNNQLWISTSKGLVLFNPESGEIIIYTKANGLLSDQFNYSSAYKDSDGTIYFGSVNGLISFNPTKFTKNTYKPPVLITGFEINNKEVPINKNGSPLEKSITLTDKIQLKSNQFTFNIDFAALSYTAPEETDYWFKLEGLNSDWVSLKKNHKVFFTELPAGKYNFKVKSLTNNGIWSEEKNALKIEILPIFWKSNIAYILYTICIGLITFISLRLYNSRIKEKNSSILRDMNNKKEKEIFQSKIEFFTNVSHEIRTPLTLIKSPLEKLLKKVGPNSEFSESLHIMDKNTSRLLELTNQLLDFRKAELDNMALTFVDTNISTLLKNTYTRFSEVIKNKKLEFNLVIGSDDVIAYVDTEALKKIVSNLFNNAIKYSEKRVIVSLSRDEHSFQLIVKNDGNLIPAYLKNKIFEPFFRGQEIKNQHQPGTGIGLSLAQALTELHLGNLSLDTTDANMNTFILKLPIHQEKEFKLNTTSEKIDCLESIEGETSKDNFSIISKPNKPSIMLVEDNLDLLDFLAKDLTTDYLVFKAENAELALKIIETENVNLIISDVMMPGMDGFSLCEKLKTDLSTSHIPVILLTSKAAMTAKIEGLESGADAYIGKPFSMEHLKVQIANLIENREHILSHYSSSPLAHIRSIAHTKTDETFIKKLDNIIFKNISDSSLSVETLAEAMNMSRSTFYRKINEMSNLSPNELVNIARLKKAAELLKSGNYKIYEVAEKVGYNSQTSFGRNFQKQFNMTPSDYMNE